MVNAIIPLGHLDGLITVWARNVEDLGEIIAYINTLPGVVRTETLVVLTDEEYPPPLGVDI